ncbi:hypothetical protein SPRG_13138 [Saprolegnia parasitica CBS 223.65]|uniref:Uncharacterized protein n=1 Tax=Saprolegnia parasitica (strain CBS 223.65) TaxID=695850 RepID=A0A067C4K6_SAPPC|nr:hypothetical protein SPRG_13138 [Saprolegnia parasitica CBS 223.65]KDO21722.1 hypothetical protein SPRG_13138 [Saprolegnia parasitica CBS 223.65]|eukprot:XP_012207525.1 hypothetical protein SPRG_13138 [Saprolegnia parasitica CBS 223.65]
MVTGEEYAALAPAIASTKLRLSASRVANVVGLHEFGDAVEIFLEYVYQDLEPLLALDARVLGLQLVSKDDELDDLMRRSGAAAALAKILGWATKTSTANITTANNLAANIGAIAACAQQAQKLSAIEAKALRNGLHEKLRVNVGKRNESIALATYEARTGLTVSASNDTFYYVLLPDLDQVSVLVDADCACARAEALEGCIERLAISKRKMQRPKAVDLNLNLNPTEAIDDKDDDIDDTDRDLSTKAHYFSLCGMVDGTTEVLHIAENDEWSTEPIVVEVKNRMHRFRDPVPLYDCIQMAVYMKMLQVRQGDMVQCLHSDQTSILVTRIQLEAYPLSSSAATACLCQRRQDLWSSVLVPRLYAYADAVYTLRRNDLRRLAFLQAPRDVQVALLKDLLPYDP